MSTNISAGLLKNFIVKTIGAEKLTQSQALKYDINNRDFDKGNTNDDNILDIEEMLKNDNIYEQFATLYEEAEKADQTDIDKEKEKEKADKVGNTGGKKA